MFQKIKAVLPIDEIRQEILRATFSGRLKPGDRLPPENRLAEQFGVRKTTVRDALKSLKAVGLLEIRRGRDGGAFVRKSNAEQAREALHTFLYLQQASTKELYDIRTMLEPEIARRAASAMNPETLDLLKQNIENFKEKLERDEPTRNVEIEFHRMLTKSLKNSFLSLIMESIFTFQTEFKRTLHLGSAFAQKVCREHAAIFELIAARDSEGAQAKMLEHMVSTAARVVAQVDSEFQPAKAVSENN